MNHTEAEIRKNVEEVTFPQVVEALTKPSEKLEIPAKAESGFRDIVFTGTFDEVNRFFEDKGWSDRFVVAPPTIDRVESFLKYTDLSPHEEVAVLPAANLRATPWNIAVNAAMAGCRPEQMPLLVAAVEAIGASPYNLVNFGTTGMLVPFLFIGGPIVKQLGIEYGMGAISRGSNPALGRALGLIVRNIAGFRPGQTYMGQWGYFPPPVLAEDEDALYEMGWKPIGVRRGFGQNASTVIAGSTMNWGFQIFPSGIDPEWLLKSICSEIVRQSRPKIMLHFGPLQQMTVLINPSVAKVIARGGYSQEDVEAYLFENSRIPRRELDFALKCCDGSGVDRTLRQMVEAEDCPAPDEWADLGPEDTIPAMGSTPGVIYTAVCGDPERNKAMALYSCYSTPQTRQVKLPVGWGELTQRLGYPPLESFYR
ncbi:hypothetical protein ACFLTZ_04890 [Chloroflexota bacterium]